MRNISAGASRDSPKPSAAIPSHSGFIRTPRRPRARSHRQSAGAEGSVDRLRRKAVSVRGSRPASAARGGLVALFSCRLPAMRIMPAARGQGGTEIVRPVREADGGTGGNRIDRRIHARGKGRRIAETLVGQNAEKMMPAQPQRRGRSLCHRRQISRLRRPRATP